MTEIKKLTVEENLIKFYNFHLNEIMACWINVEFYMGLNPEDKIAEKVTPPIQQGQIPYRIEVKVKEMLEEEIKKFENQAGILRSIEKRLEDVKKLKSDNEIWVLNK